MKLLSSLLLLSAAGFANSRSDDRAFRTAVRNHGFVHGFGVSDSQALQRKSGRLLVLSDAVSSGDPGQELERQLGALQKKRHPKQVFAAGKKWSSKIAKFGSDGDVMQVDFDENDIAASDLAASLRASKKFRFVEPDLLIERHGVGDGYKAFDRKGYMGPRASQGDATHVVVAFLDTGLDFNNPLFAGVVKTGAKILSEGSDQEMQDVSEMDYNGHGTQMAGLALGVAGGFDESAKRNVRVMGVKVLNAEGFGSLSDLVKGIQWASENGAQVLNISAGTPQRSELLESVVRSVLKRGIAVVASAGNTASELREYPAAIPGVVSVGATDIVGRIADFSNHGPDVDLYAQGVELTSIEANPAKSERTVWGGVSGTSASAAIVSGAMAAVATRGGTVVSAKNRVLNEAISAYGSDLQPEVIKRLNLASTDASGTSLSRDSLYVSAYPVYKVLGLADTATFDVLVANASSNSVKDRELCFKVEGSKSVKDVVVHSGAIPSSGQARVKVSVPAKDVCEGECRIYASVVSGPGLQGRVIGDVSVSTKSQAKLSIADLWVEANQADGARSFRFSVFNRTAWNLSHANVSLDVRSGIGDGYSSSPSNVVLEQDLTDFAPGTKRSFSVALPDSLASESRLGAQIAIASQGRIVGRKRRDFQGLGSDKLEVFYNQRSHQRQAQEAINLLVKQGIKLPELSNQSYLGVPGEEAWPETARSPMQEGYATGSTYTMYGRPTEYVTTDLTLMNGLNDVDGVDVIFGYTGPLVGGDRFDSHFWIVDDDDDDGLDDHHSALTKVRALLFGRAGASDSRWKYGAIDHYKHGDKHAAYWLLGQAAHLLGDMSVPEHVDDENWHGVWGSAYENWMAKNSYRWTADHAWAKGGIVDPYRTNGRLIGPHPELGNPLRNDDPVRFLMYTTAQVANAFPWYSLGWKGGYDNCQNGNVDFGTNPGSRYEDYLNPILASLPTKPRAKADLKDNSTNDGNDNDGDLSTIASNSYVNGIRAVAGLLYYFGIETGQIPKPKSNPAMSAIQQLLLD